MIIPTSLCFQKVPVVLSVFPLQFAKLSVLANPVIYVIMNKAVSEQHMTYNKDIISVFMFIDFK